VVQDDPDWWQGTNSKGYLGLFPATFVEIVGSVPVSSAFVPTVPTFSQPQVSSISTARGKSATAIYDYEAAEDNEINFFTGDIITEIDFVSDDWWSGTVKGRTGLFPGNYVQLN
jgi:hypothetical protein